MEEPTVANEVETSVNTEETVEPEVKATEPEGYVKREIFDELEKNYKAAQRNLDSARKQGGGMLALQERLNKIELAVAQTADDIEDKIAKAIAADPSASSSPKRTATVKSRQEQELVTTKLMEEQANVFWGAVDESGINRDDPELLKEVLDKSNSPTEALRKLTPFVKKKFSAILPKEETKVKPKVNPEALKLDKSSGSVAMSDDVFLDKFGKGEIEYNKPNKERFLKIRGG